MHLPLTALELALERTFLSHVRFGLVLFALTTSFLCRVRFPQPGKGVPLPDRIALLGDITTPFGVAYAGATMMVLFAGSVYYERSYRVFRLGRGFVGGESKWVFLGFRSRPSEFFYVCD